MALPNMIHIADRRPRVMARLVSSSTDGPGIADSSADRTRNPTTRLGFTGTAATLPGRAGSAGHDETSAGVRGKSFASDDASVVRWCA
ncbi:hypothetical protein GCM10027070_27230 [Barrientosiimonas humi]